MENTAIAKTRVEEPSSIKRENSLDMHVETFLEDVLGMLGRTLRTFFLFSLRPRRAAECVSGEAG